MGGALSINRSSASSIQSPRQQGSHVEAHNSELVHVNNDTAVARVRNEIIAKGAAINEAKALKMWAIREYKEKCEELINAGIAAGKANHVNATELKSSVEDLQNFVTGLEAEMIAKIHEAKFAEQNQAPLSAVDKYIANERRVANVMMNAILPMIDQKIAAVRARVASN